MMSRHRIALLLSLLMALTIPTASWARLRLSKDGRQGRRLLLGGRYAAAAAAFQRAVDRGHPAPAELEGLGYCRLKAAQFPQAAEAYRVLCGLYPRKAPLWVNLGLSYAYQEPAHMDDAEKAFRGALAVDPRDPNALLNLAVLLHRLGRPQEALPLYEK